MLYRIKIGTIVDGEWKLDQYATEEELIRLKPSSDGGVLRITDTRSSYLPDKMMIDWDVTPTGIYLISDWQDVSDTHRIEWGTIYNGVAVYENDIVHYKHEYVYIDPMRAHEKSNKYHVARYVINQVETGELMLRC
jgi:hypothetical protein